MRKKIILGICLGFASFTNIQAQESLSNNTIGIRFSYNNGLGPEVSYQRLLNDNNRLELDLGWRQSKHIDAFKLTGLYQWIWNIEGGFYWYAGAGASIGSWRQEYGHYNDSGTIFSVDGNIGFEYNFDFPLQVFVDFRPEIYLTDYNDNNFGPDLGLGARFKF